MILLKRLATAALSFVVMSGAAPVMAHAAVPPAATAPAQTPAQTALFQNWMADTAIWTQGYEALTSSRLETLIWLLDSAVPLLERLYSEGGDGAKPLFAAWAVEARSRLAAEMDVYRGLSTQAPAFPASLPREARSAGLITLINQTPDRIGSLMISTTQASENYVRVIEAAGSGKAADLAEVDNARLELMIAQAEAQNVMLQSASAGMEGPNLHFARGQIASSQAMIVWMRHNKQLFAGHQADGAVAARDMREHLSTMNAEVTNMEQSLDVFEAELAAMGDFRRTDLGLLYGSVAISLRESVVVERKMVEALDQLAEAVRSGDQEGYLQPTTRMEALARERMRLDASRRQLIANAGR